MASLLGRDFYIYCLGDRFGNNTPHPLLVSPLFFSLFIMARVQRHALRSCRSSLLKAVLILLNICSTALTLFTGLRENPILVLLTGRYDSIRQRLVDGSINYETAATELFRANKLTPLEEIGETYRFVTAPRRDPSTIGEYRSVCTNLNSNAAPVMALMYDDFWGKGPRRVQVFVYSISAPHCQVVNVKTDWRDACVATYGNASACHQYVLANFETLQQNRSIQVSVVRDFGGRGVPLLKCLHRPYAPFNFQADLLAHQTYWSGAKNHVMIQTSECRAVPLAGDSSLHYSLFESQGVDEGADVLLALPPSGWLSWIVTQAYNAVTLAMIVRGLGLALAHNRFVRYLPHAVRYSYDRRALRYVAPFMPTAIFFTDNARLVVTFKGSLLVASDVWMNHWLYMYLSILDALSNIRLTYITLQVGTWMLNMKFTLESFLFICAAIMKITWIMCLLQTLIRVVLKFSVRTVRAMRLVTATTRTKLEWNIDSVALFLSYKLNGILLCLILSLLVLCRGTTTFMERDTPYKVGAYGGLPQITSFWQSEIMCDLLTLLATLTLCGHTVGLCFLFSKYGRIADNSLLRLLQQRYCISGWDALLAADMLGLDPNDPECLESGGAAQARAKFGLGSLLQLLYLSGPSAFVHLAGDYIFHHGGFTREPVEFQYPVSLATQIGLLQSARRGSSFTCSISLPMGETPRAASVHPDMHRTTTAANASTVSIPTASLDASSGPETSGPPALSVFDRTVRVVSDGYFGKVLLVDEAYAGALTTNKDTGLYEYVVTDALARVRIADMQHLLSNSRKLHCT
jgi:hypothetical protein